MDDIPRLDQLVNDFKNGKNNENFNKYVKFFKGFVEKLKDDGKKLKN